MNTQRSEKIAFELVETNFFTRWHCDACGGNTEKVPILCEEKVETLPKGHRRLRICEFCLKEESKNPGFFDRMLEKHASDLEAEARQLRTNIGRLEVPSYAQYEARTAQHELEFVLSGHSNHPKENGIADVLVYWFRNTHDRLPTTPEEVDFFVKDEKDAGRFTLDIDDTHLSAVAFERSIKMHPDNAVSILDDQDDELVF